jgi:hypothetical protein
VTTVVVRADLVDALEKSPELQQKTVDDLVNEAVARYIQDLQSNKLNQEIRAYERLHAELKDKCLGRWVAIHQGQLVDQDAERVELYRRVRARYGKTAVLIRQVREQPTEEIRWRGGSLRWQQA